MKLQVALIFILAVFTREDTKEDNKKESDNKSSEPPVRTNLERADNKARFPDNLTDANEDGRLDEGDFIRGFTSTVLLLSRK